jgi:glycerol-3-phosphate dehydrogenase (NAD(P)+)
LQAAEVIMLAVPMQQLTQFLITHATVLDGHPLIACCKGMDLHTGLGPIEILAQHCPRSLRALLTGPGFAEEIARGLPTALTLAGGDADLQALLSTPTLRLYRTNDVIGAELGGALKNVIAIAAGVVTGAGLGASARAALLTRGFSEMVRVAVAMGGRAETLSGLSGLGDLVLTASSEQSRNFRFGIALGLGQDFDPGTTVEGAATALAIADQAQRRGVDLPLMTMVAALVERKVTVSAAIETLFSRPLKEE